MVQIKVHMKMAKRWIFRGLMSKQLVDMGKDELIRQYYKINRLEIVVHPNCWIKI